MSWVIFIVGVILGTGIGMGVSAVFGANRESDDPWDWIDRGSG